MPIDIASTQESSANVVAVATAAASGAGASKDEDVLTNKNGGRMVVQWNIPIKTIKPMALKFRLNNKILWNFNCG